MALILINSNLYNGYLSVKRLRKLINQNTIEFLDNTQNQIDLDALLTNLNDFNGETSVENHFRFYNSTFDEPIDAGVVEDIFRGLEVQMPIKNFKFHKHYKIDYNDLMNFINSLTTSHLHVRFASKNKKHHMALGGSDGNMAIKPQGGYLMLTNSNGNKTQCNENDFKEFKKEIPTEPGGIVYLKSTVIDYLKTQEGGTVYFYPGYDDEKSFATVMISFFEDLDTHKFNNRSEIVAFDKGGGCCPL